MQVSISSGLGYCGICSLYLHLLGSKWFYGLFLEFSNFCAIVSDILRTGVEQYRAVGNICALYTDLAAKTDIAFLIRAKSLIRDVAVLSTICEWTLVFSEGSKYIPRYLYLDVKV